MHLNALILIALGISVFTCSPSKQANTSQPNVVFLLVDDLGWSDLGCYGSSFHETPNIDQLASTGIRFSNAYASCPVCSPTRASILTGKYPAQLNITDWIPGLDPKDRPLLGTKDHHELPLEEVTLAECFRDAGYYTGFLGKWHLGQTDYYPEHQGFDINIGGHHAGQPASYFYPYKNKRKHWDVPGLEGGQPGEYLTDRLTDEAITFIQQNKANPFLLYLAYYTVHTPIQGKPELVTKYQEKWDTTITIQSLPFSPERDVRTKTMQNNPSYAAMVQSLDESVGRILQQLKHLNLSENTIIVFTSDNGGLSTLPINREAPTSVFPLRAGKGWLYEGGIRVPLIVKWPGHLPSGIQSDFPVISNDFLPTLLDMAHIPIPATYNGAGLNLTPFLNEKTSFPDRALYWHFPHYHGSGNRPSAAVRFGPYKLIQWFEDGVFELYNLENDLSEQVNLIDSLSNRADQLKAMLSNWQEEEQVQFPTVNPDYRE